MKHLPIKSNDACDLKGIKVKWCIQPDYGHLQMAKCSWKTQSPSVARAGIKLEDEPGTVSASDMS